MATTVATVAFPALIGQAAPAVQAGAALGRGLVGVGRLAVQGLV